jgi:hypothetical protein
MSNYATFIKGVSSAEPVEEVEPIDEKSNLIMKDEQHDEITNTTRKLTWLHKFVLFIMFLAASAIIIFIILGSI